MFKSKTRVFRGTLTDFEAMVGCNRVDGAIVLETEAIRILEVISHILHETTSNTPGAQLPPS